MTNRLLSLLAALAVLGACDNSTDTADVTDTVEAGEALYKERCAGCHGMDLEGQPNWQAPADAYGTVPAPPLNDEGTVWQRSDDLLFRSIKLGGDAIVPSGFHSDMPGFAQKLTDEQIWQLLSYIKSRWSPMIRARQERMNTN